MQELTPTGKLRVGVAFAPSPSPLFVVKAKDGAAHGVTIDLGNELAKQLNAEAEFLSLLKADGRSCADAFLREHGDDLGKRSTADLDVLLAEV